MLLPLLISVFSLATNDVPKDPLPKSTVVKSTSLNKQVLLQMVNKARKSGCRCGDTWYPAAPLLTWNDKLEQAALKHSADMLTKKFFNHKSPDGSNGGSRIEAAGYKWMTFGENIAFGYISEVQVIEGWLKSPGHCKNIMNKYFREMAVARAGNYWTQTFGAR